MSLPKQKNLKPLNLDQRFAIKTFNKECWSMIPQEKTPGWQASLLGRPANRRDRWGGPLWVWHDDSMMIVMILLYVYIYMYIPVYIIRSLCFSVLTVCQKKMPLGGEFGMEWHATKKTNSRWACLINSSSFWASAQPTLGRSVLAVLRPLRTSDESWWDLTQHIKNTATCVSSSLSLRNCQGHSRTWRCFVETPCMTS